MMIAPTVAGRVAGGAVKLMNKPISIAINAAKMSSVGVTVNAFQEPVWS